VIEHTSGACAWCDALRWRLHGTIVQENGIDVCRVVVP
jgi:hypothetical protein